MLLLQVPQAVCRGSVLQVTSSRRAICHRPFDRLLIVGINFSVPLLPVMYGKIDGSAFFPRIDSYGIQYLEFGINDEDLVIILLDNWDGIKIGECPFCNSECTPFD